MQIVSNGDNLHEMSNPIFLWKIRKKIMNLSSAEFAHTVVKDSINLFCLGTS